jgi:hypothetical protein
MGMFYAKNRFGIMMMEPMDQWHYFVIGEDKHLKDYLYASINGISFVNDHRFLCLESKT